MLRSRMGVKSDNGDIFVAVRIATRVSSRQLAHAFTEWSLISGILQPGQQRYSGRPGPGRYAPPAHDGNRRQRPAHTASLARRSAAWHHILTPRERTPGTGGARSRANIRTLQLVAKR